MDGIQANRRRETLLGGVESAGFQADFSALHPGFDGSGKQFGRSIKIAQGRLQIMVSPIGLRTVAIGRGITRVEFDGARKARDRRLEFLLPQQDDSSVVVRSTVVGSQGDGPVIVGNGFRIALLHFVEQSSIVVQVGVGRLLGDGVAEGCKGFVDPAVNGQEAAAFVQN